MASVAITQTRGSDGEDKEPQDGGAEVLASAEGLASNPT